MRRGSGRTAATSASPPSMMAPAASQSGDECLAVEVAPGQQRAEHGRPEQGAEHGAEQDERDAAGAALGRVHVAGRRAGEQRHAARRARRPPSPASTTSADSMALPRAASPHPAAPAT